jgi:glyoxylase-like metal-dependent hydrolase (beta-lactamase superfamily II)
MHKIASSVYVSTEYPGVTLGAIATPDGVICVDAPIRPDDVRDWQEQIASVSDAPIRYVVNTDAQRDRVIGQQWLGATVVATEAAGEKMRSYNEAFRQQVADMMVQLDALEVVEDVLLNFRVVQPQITFNGKLILHTAKPRVEVWSVGGATPGSAWVVLPDARVVFAGDLVTSNVHPYIYESNTQVWLERLTELRKPAFPATKIVPGRGSVLRKEGTQKTSAYVRDARSKVRALIKARRPKSDVATLAPGFMARYRVSDDERELVQRRVRIGLEHIYEELS